MEVRFPGKRQRFSRNDTLGSDRTDANSKEQSEAIFLLVADLGSVFRLWSLRMHTNSAGSENLPRVCCRGESLQGADVPRTGSWTRLDRRPIDRRWGFPIVPRKGNCRCGPPNARLSTDKGPMPMTANRLELAAVSTFRRRTAILLYPRASSVAHTYRPSIRPGSAATATMSRNLPIVYRRISQHAGVHSDNYIHPLRWTRRLAGHLFCVARGQ